MRILLSILFLLLSSANLVIGQEIVGMTYNVRNDNPNDGENIWTLRKDFLSGQIKFYKPDVIGTQEVKHSQIKYLDNTLVNYKYVGVARNDGKTKGEYSAIFYNTKKLNLIQSSTFWLSDTPEVISVGWDASLTRICTYAQFEIINSGKRIWVFNTHFDHKGEQAQINSAKLITKKIKELNKADEPFLFMGDLNIEPDGEVYKYLSENFKDSRDISLEDPFGPESTFNGFRFHEPATKRIDYVFVGKTGLQVSNYATLTDSKDCKYPSDHFPIIVKMNLQE